MGPSLCNRAGAVNDGDGNVMEPPLGVVVAESWFYRFVRAVSVAECWFYRFIAHHMQVWLQHAKTS